MLDSRDSEIINIIRNKKECSSKEIFDSLSITVSYATVKRILTKLNAENLIETKGKGKGTKYLVSSAYETVILPTFIAPILHTAKEPFSFFI